jgi:protein gp37
MSDKSAIEWTDATWNPTVGCSIVSPGCTNCYAMKVANGLERRFGSEKYRGLTKVVNGNAVWTGEVRLDEAALLQPLKWKRGRRIFVNSMSDLFHEALSDADIDRVFAIMALCPQHTFQVLTKRAERMQAYVTKPHPVDGLPEADSRIDKIMRGMGYMNEFPWPLPNVWLGVSAERQKEADERIPHLLATRAAVRFISAEPLLGPIDLMEVIPNPIIYNAVHGMERLLGWVIVGGESGGNARPMHPSWARTLRDQCAATGVSFFFKQWGEWAKHRPQAGGDLGGDVRAGRVRIVHPTGQSDVEVSETTGGHNTIPGSRYMIRVGKKAAGRLLDGVEHNGFPEVRSCS